MTDLAAWLLAVIDNDEWNARQDRVSAEVDGWEWYVLRVLAECAAKRAIVEMFAETESVYRAYVDAQDYLDSFLSDTRIAVEALTPVLQALAQPYRDREGWRDEWEVAG